MRTWACLIGLCLPLSSFAVKLVSQKTLQKNQTKGSNFLIQKNQNEGVNFPTDTISVFGKTIHRHEGLSPQTETEQKNAHHAFFRHPPGEWNFVDNDVHLAMVIRALTTKPIKGVHLGGDLGAEFPVFGGGPTSAAWMAEFAKYVGNGINRMPKRVARRIVKLLEELQEAKRRLWLHRNWEERLPYGEAPKLEKRVEALRIAIADEVNSIVTKWNGSKGEDGGKVMLFHSNIVDEPKKNVPRPPDGHDLIGGDNAAKLLNGIGYAIGSPIKRYTPVEEQVTNIFQALGWMNLPRSTKISTMGKSQGELAGAAFRAFMKRLGLGDVIASNHSIVGPLFGGVGSSGLAKFLGWRDIAKHLGGERGLRAYDALTPEGVEKLAHSYGYPTVEAFIKDNVDAALVGQMTYVDEAGNTQMATNEFEEYARWANDLREYKGFEDTDALVTKKSARGGLDRSYVMTPYRERWLGGKYQATGHGKTRIDERSQRWFLKQDRNQETKQHKQALDNQLPELMNVTDGKFLEGPVSKVPVKAIQRR